jgi:hypothetical protein
MSLEAKFNRKSWEEYRERKLEPEDKKSPKLTKTLALGAGARLHLLVLILVERSEDVATPGHSDQRPSPRSPRNTCHSRI